MAQPPPPYADLTNLLQNAGQPTPPGTIQQASDCTHVGAAAYTEFVHTTSAHRAVARAGRGGGVSNNDFGRAAATAVRVSLAADGVPLHGIAELATRDSITTLHDLLRDLGQELRQARADSFNGFARISNRQTGNQLYPLKREELRAEGAPANAPGPGDLPPPNTFPKTLQDLRSLTGAQLNTLAQHYAMNDLPPGLAARRMAFEDFVMGR